MTKKEYKELLDEAGVKYDPRATLAELEELALENELVEEEEETDEDEGEEKDEAEAEEEDVEDEKEVDVISGDNYIRTYSLERHGKKFLALARQFAGQKPDRKIVPPVEKLIVSWRVQLKDKSYKAESVILTAEESGKDYKAEALRLAKLHEREKSSVTVR